MMKFKNRETGIVLEPATDEVAALLMNDIRYVLQKEESTTVRKTSKLEFDAVVNVTNIGGGDSTNVAALEFDVMSHGKPTYTPAATV